MHPVGGPQLEGSRGAGADLGPLTRREVAAVACYVASLAAMVLSLYLPWGRGTNDASLASRPGGLLDWAPAVLLLAGLVVIAWPRRARGVAVSVGALLALWWLVSQAAATALSLTGWNPLGPGHLVSFVGLGLLIVGVALAWPKAGIGWRVDRASVAWAGAGGTLGVLWVVGEWLPWTRMNLHIGGTGTWPATRTKDWPWTCCVAFRHGSAQSNIGTAAGMGLVVVAAVVLAFVLPRVVAGATTAALGLLYLTENVGWLRNVLRGTVNPHDLNAQLSRAVIDRYRITATYRGLPGAWLSLVACLGLIAAGLLRAWKASRAPGHRVDEVPPAAWPEAPPLEAPQDALAAGATEPPPSPWAVPTPPAGQAF